MVLSFTGEGVAPLDGMGSLFSSGFFNVFLNFEKNPPDFFLSPLFFLSSVLALGMSGGLSAECLSMLVATDFVGASIGAACGDFDLGWLFFYKNIVNEYRILIN